MGTVMNWHTPTAFAVAIAASLMPVTPSAVANASDVRSAAICGRHADLMAGFAQEFGETPVVSAVTDRGHAMEVLVSQDGTWTIVVTSPGGPSCAIATGQDWEQIKLEPSQISDRPI